MSQSEAPRRAAGRSDFVSELLAVTPVIRSGTAWIRAVAGEWSAELERPVTA